jgi:hypothetical protein
MIRSLCVGVVALVISAASAVRAEPAAPSAADVQRAAQSFDLGRQSYKAEDWVVAAEQFEAADGFAPSPGALELAIHARENAGQLDRAATLSALALLRNPDQAELVQLANDVLERARAQLHEVTVTCGEACDLTVDNKLVHGGPNNQRTIYLNPGVYTIRASWSDERSKDQKVAAEAGGKSEIPFSAPEATVLEDDDPDDASGTPNQTSNSSDEPAGADQGPTKASSGLPPIVFWVGAGLTAAAGGVTIWSGLDTQNNPGVERVREECMGKDESCPAYKDGLAKQQRTNILIGGTAVVGVATIVVGAFFTDWGGGGSSAKAKPSALAGKASARSVSVQPWAVVGDGALLGASGTF